MIFKSQGIVNVKGCQDNIMYLAISEIIYK